MKKGFSAFFLPACVAMTLMGCGIDTESPEAKARQAEYQKRQAIKAKKREFWNFNHVCAAAGAVMVSGSKFKLTSQQNGYSATLNGKNEVTCSYPYGGDSGSLAMKSVYKDLGRTSIIKAEGGQFQVRTNLSSGDLQISVTCFSRTGNTYSNYVQMINFTFVASDFNDGIISREEADIEVMRKAGGYCLGLGPNSVS